MKIPPVGRSHIILSVLLYVISMALFVGVAQPAAPARQTPALVLRPAAAQAQTGDPAAFPTVPYELISQESLFAYLQDLTSIQPYSGWRSAGTRGEAEALDYVRGKLGGFTTLQGWGMELERQSFKVFMSTEFWETRLFLTVSGREVEASAEGMRGSRWVPLLARAMDSDGALNDSRRDPLAASGPILAIRDANTLYNLEPKDVKGRVLFLDYALVDTITEPDALDHGYRLLDLMDQGALGLVLVSQFSNAPGVSHGVFAGDGAVFQYLDRPPNAHIPILHARLADLSSAGIAGWDDFAQVDSARMIWDTDVRSPGQSANLVARIPGLDGSRAVILGAHIDSPNNPGAFDDGSGSAALLEVARVLNESRARPAVDLYLAWFGGHEIGGYGSAHFASTHQELLDRALAMIQMDCLGHPLDGRNAEITLSSTSYDRFGDDRLPWSDFLTDLAASQGLAIEQEVLAEPTADHSNFDIYNLPNADLIYINQDEFRVKGNAYIHYAMRWHDPYDTVEMVQDVGDVLVEMTRVILAAALETGRSERTMRLPTQPVRRALLVSSHTETVTIGPSMFRDLGMALAWEGFDVDLVPYGQALSPADLENAGVVILLPTLDYPGRHDEAWSEKELAALQSYLEAGGFLVVTNSGYNHVMVRRVEDSNEDARDLNDLLEPMGIRLMFGSTGEDIVRAAAKHPLMDGAGYLAQYGGNGVPIRMKSGLVLARSDGNTVIGLLDYGNLGGQVLALADLGILQADGGAKNLKFIQNLAHYARLRGQP